MSNRKLANTLFVESVMLWPTIFVLWLAFWWLIKTHFSIPPYALKQLLILLPLCWINASLMHLGLIHINGSPRSPASGPGQLFWKVVWSIPIFIAIFSGNIERIPHKPLIISVGILIILAAWYETPSMFSPRSARRLSFANNSNRGTLFICMNLRSWPWLRAFLIGFGLSLIPWAIILGTHDARNMDGLYLIIIFMPGFGILQAWTREIRALRSLPMTTRRLTLYCALVPFFYTIGCLIPLTALSIWLGDWQLAMQLPVIAIMSIALPILVSSFEMHAIPQMLAAIPFCVMITWFHTFVTEDPISEYAQLWMLASALAALIFLFFTIKWLKQDIADSNDSYRRSNVEER